MAPGAISYGRPNDDEIALLFVRQDLFWDPFHDGQIDQLVYELYELTPDEIKIVEATAGSSAPPSLPLPRRKEKARCGESLRLANPGQDGLALWFRVCRNSQLQLGPQAVLAAEGAAGDAF